MEHIGLGALKASIRWLIYLFPAMNTLRAFISANEADHGVTLKPNESIYCGLAFLVARAGYCDAVGSAFDDNPV